MEGFNFGRKIAEEDNLSDAEKPISNDGIAEINIETEKVGFFKKFENIKEKLKEVGGETKDFLQPGIDNPIATIYEIAQAVIGVGTTGALIPSIINGVPSWVRPGEGFLYVVATLSTLLAANGIMSIKERFSPQ